MQAVKNKKIYRSLLLIATCLISACRFDHYQDSDTSATTSSYNIGGSVSGLNGNVVLENNNGDDLTLASNGSFSFATAVTDGSSYNVTVKTQPDGQTCSVSSGSGTVSSANVTSVAVSCVANTTSSNTYTLGGSVSGLDGSVVLENNSGDDLTLASNGSFSFATAITDGSSYSVTVKTQPDGQTCSVSSGSGTVSSANVTSVAVSCTTNTYSIGGTVSGLSGTLILQNNSGDDLSLNSDGDFSFASAVDDGSSYSVTVLTQPSGQYCSVSSGSGTVSSAAVTSVAISCASAPAAPSPSLSYGLKTFAFSWTAVTDATYYQLYENADGASGFSLVADNITATSYDITNIVLYNRINAQYMVAACNAAGCTDSSAISVSNTLVEAVGYFKASNAGASDNFGKSVALSRDGSTMVVGAYEESGDASSTTASPNDNATYAGAAYVFVKDSDGNWSQSGYLKASNAGSGDEFGVSVAVSDDGATIAVGADLEDGDASSTVANPNDNALNSGAAYVFSKDSDGNWSQSAYIKASNAGQGDYFGLSLSLSSDGTELAVGAYLESGDASSTAASPNDNASDAGAAYVFSLSGSNWVQDAYLKASNAESSDYFGAAVSLSADGATLAVGDFAEDGDASSTSTSPNNNASYAGAVYMFSKASSSWSQTAYLKASNARANSDFGYSVALSADGTTLAVGTIGEYGDASSTMDSPNTNAAAAGAVYIFSQSGSSWSQTGYLKASNTEAGDELGYGVAISSDGTTVAVSAPYEDGISTGIDGSDNNSAFYGGAAYLFSLSDGSWSQQHYIKASNSRTYLYFGLAIALADDGTLAATSYVESNNASGISFGVTSSDQSLSSSGALYLY
ncbi:beta strand repeat-containing protein [Gallaecimonas mangrovi]|uniref:beta strand repeat-containing protein n=1 Tax=Gallaecimonas mangrovi TaxID=2291597 RepID=UPI001866DB5F|nr:hypothetical protein [Gallaecimonas mangrovi]